MLTKILAKGIASKTYRTGNRTKEKALEKAKELMLKDFIRIGDIQDIEYIKTNGLYDVKLKGEFRIELYDDAKTTEDARKVFEHMTRNVDMDTLEFTEVYVVDINNFVENENFLYFRTEKPERIINE